MSISGIMRPLERVILQENVGHPIETNGKFVASRPIPKSI